MGPRKDVSEERRSQILQAAAAVFTRAGFNDARMDDIANEAGLSKGSLYWYFNSKEDIIVAILDAMFDRETQYLAEIITRQIGAAEKLELFLDVALADLDGLIPLMPMMFEYWSLINRKQEIRQRIGSYYNGFFAVLTPIIQNGVDSGEFRQVDVNGVVNAIGAIFEGMIIVWAAVPERVDLRRDIAAAVQLVLSGLKPVP